MDQTMVDVTALPEVSPGSEVVLMGADGREALSASELAARAGTIEWDIFTGLGARVRKIAVS
jgi:alanine racemase